MGPQFGYFPFGDRSELGVGDEQFDQTLCISSIGSDSFNLKTSIYEDQFNSLVN